MNVFISWSGLKGKKLAEALREWVPTVIQAAKPFYSPDDIAKGNKWNQALTERLRASKFGIIVVTPESKDAPWLLFEAGAISNSFSDTFVCPLLFGLGASDITGPLLQFQVTQFERAEIRKLVITINTALGEDRLEDAILDNAFSTFWPKLEEKVAAILTTSGNPVVSPIKRSDRELLEEVLRLSRRMSATQSRPSRSDPNFSSELAKVVTFDASDQCIKLHSSSVGMTYDIELERLDSAAEVLDFVFQIASKGWSTPSHVYQFVQMLEELSQSAFGSNAQGVFCPMGENKSVSWPPNIEV